METFESIRPSDRRRIYCAFLWRAIVVGFGSMLVGGLLGGVLGFFVGIATHLRLLPATMPVGLLQLVGFVVGMLVGFWFTWLYVCWLFRATLGGFRLRLVRAADVDPADAVGHRLLPPEDL